MTRTQTAEMIAREARVFVRKARAQGASNKITVLLFQETAGVLGIPGDDYSIRTVKQLARRDAEFMDETELIGF